MSRIRTLFNFILAYAIFFDHAQAQNSFGINSPDFIRASEAAIKNFNSTQAQKSFGINSPDFIRASAAAIQNFNGSEIAFPSNIDYNKLFAGEGKESDKSSFCPYWAILGECDTNPDYMQNSCPHACSSLILGGESKKTSESDISVSNEEEEETRTQIEKKTEEKFFSDESLEIINSFPLVESARKKQQTSDVPSIQFSDPADRSRLQEAELSDEDDEDYSELGKVYDDYQANTLDKIIADVDREEAKDTSKVLDELEELVRLPLVSRPKQIADDHDGEDSDYENETDEITIPTSQIVIIEGKEIGGDPEIIEQEVQHSPVASTKSTKPEYWPRRPPAYVRNPISQAFMNPRERLNSVRNNLNSFRQNFGLPAGNVANTVPTNPRGPYSTSMTLNDPTAPIYPPPQSNPIAVSNSAGGSASPPGFFVRPRDQLVLQQQQINKLRERFSLPPVPKLPQITQPRIVFPRFNLTSLYPFRNPVRVAQEQHPAVIQATPGFFPQNPTLALQSQSNSVPILPQHRPGAAIVDFQNPKLDLSTVLRGPDGKLYGIHPIAESGTIASSRVLQAPTGRPNPPAMKGINSMVVPISPHAVEMFSPQRIRQMLVELYGEQAKNYQIELPDRNTHVKVKALTVTVEPLSDEETAATPVESTLKLVATIPLPDDHSAIPTANKKSNH